MNARDQIFSRIIFDINVLHNIETKCTLTPIPTDPQFPLCWINKRLEAHSDTRDWQTIRRLLGTHSLVTTRLPLADGRTINIRKPSQPDDEQKRVYQMLGIDWKSAFPTKKTEIPA